MEEYNPPIVEVKNLVKKFGRHIVLDNINLQIKRGEVFGIIGESGGGKTTLLKTIVGFLMPDAGAVFFEKHKVLRPVHDYVNEAKPIFGFAAQEPSFYLQLKVYENLEHFGALHGLSRIERQQNADRLLKLVGLEHVRDMLTVKLSGGMRRRIGLITATIHNPDVFVLDEPTADLDPSSRKQIMEFIRKVKKDGKTVVIASHLLEDLEAICDRIAVIHNNTVVKVGTVDELKSSYARLKTIFIETKERKYDLIKEKLDKKNLKIEDITIDGNKLVIMTRDAEKSLGVLLNLMKKNKMELTDIHITKPSLQHLFDSIVNEKVSKPVEIQEANEPEKEVATDDRGYQEHSNQEL